ncbi:hypothetical protein AWH04_03995 [Rhodococcus erythropolis]|nr:hypothetical protein AWH04_03995 [Rhodococcus erythropolis]
MPTNAKPQAHRARSQLSPAHHLGEGATYPTQHNETAQNFAALTNTQIDTQIETGRRKSMAFEVPKLTDRQQEVISHWQSFNVPGQWLIGQPDKDGVVEAIMKGENIEWSLTIEPFGESAESSREPGGTWVDGITV